MNGYTKLFNSLITSTIWSEDDKTRILWITMLAMADKNGEIQGSIPGLARIAGISVADTETALAKFLAPDKYSRTSTNEGRRIEIIAGGWWLINHEEYRRRASLEDSKQKNAERQSRFRRKKIASEDVTPSNGISLRNNGGITHSTDIADTDTDTDTKRREEPLSGSGGKLVVSRKLSRKPAKPKPDADPSLALPHGELFAVSWQRWKNHRSEIKKPLKPTMMDSQLKRMAGMSEAAAVAMMEHTIEKGWQGLVDPSEGQSWQKGRVQTGQDESDCATLW